jgi:hypothetical protein
MLRQVGEEVEGIKPWSEPSASARASDLHVEVLLEVLRVFRVEQQSASAWQAA